MDVSTYEHIVQCTFGAQAIWQLLWPMSKIHSSHGICIQGGRQNKPTTVTEDEKHMPN